MVKKYKNQNSTSIVFPDPKNIEKSGMIHDSSHFCFYVKMTKMYRYSQGQKKVLHPKNVNANFQIHILLFFLFLLI